MEIIYIPRMSVSMVQVSQLRLYSRRGCTHIHGTVSHSLKNIEDAQYWIIKLQIWI